MSRPWSSFPLGCWRSRTPRRKLIFSMLPVDVMVFDKYILHVMESAAVLPVLTTKHFWRRYCTPIFMVRTAVHRVVAPGEGGRGRGVRGVEVVHTYLTGGVGPRGPPWASVGLQLPPWASVGLRRPPLAPPCLSGPLWASPGLSGPLRASPCL